MVNESSDSTNPSRGRVPKRLIFISHAHADRKLAQALQRLVRAVFAGVVEPYASSDPTPGGGIQPGEEWDPAIHEHLDRAEAVWVLATPTSITHPWLYWEAGIGRARSPHGVTVLRVGLAQEEIPSPLSAFQGFDGLAEGDGGMGELLKKVAGQIDMAPTAALLAEEVKTWVAAAEAHQPDEPASEAGLSLTPEHVNKIEALMSRMEQSSRAVEELVRIEVHRRIAREVDMRMRPPVAAPPPLEQPVPVASPSRFAPSPAAVPPAPAVPRGRLGLGFGGEDQSLDTDDLPF